MKLLIVEDDPLVGPAMKAVLLSVGHEVVGPARDAAKALRLVERERPDLALVDYNLSGGENGLNLLRTLKERHGVPSLLVTGYDHRGDEARGVALGCLVKPFAPDVLIQSVTAAEEVLAGLRPSSPPDALTIFQSSTSRPPTLAA